MSAKVCTDTAQTCKRLLRNVKKNTEVRDFVRRSRPLDAKGHKHGYRLAPVEPGGVRTIRLTAKGEREAFLQALDRIMDKAAHTSPR